MREYKLLIITIIATLICMPVMLFLFAGNEVYAGNMHLEDVPYDDGRDAVKMTLDAESNASVVEGITDDVEISLGIPLEYGTETDKINVYEDKSASLIKISVPTEDKNYYYRNELTGSQKGIASLVYDYADGYAEFDITTAGYYISTVHLTERELYLELTSPKELYGHVFLIDAAHGGEDAGNSAYGVTEKNVALNIAQTVAQKAEENGTGGFYFTRNTDEAVSSEDRTKLAALLSPDVFISFHVNADGDTRVTNGISAVVSNPADEAEAGRLISVIASETGQQDLGVTVEESAESSAEHSVLIYTGYITNKAEALKMGNGQYTDKVGDVVYAWLMQLETDDTTDSK